MSTQLGIDEPLVFLSYAKEDRAKAAKLYEHLHALNLRPWLDQHHLSPGQDWDLTIRQAIGRCRFFLVLLSNRSVNKQGYVQREIRLALRIAEEQPEGRVYIVPVRIEPCDVPDGLSHLQWIDIYKPGEKNKLIQSLVRYLGDVYVAPQPTARRAPAPKGLPPLDQVVCDLIAAAEVLVAGQADKSRYVVSDARFLVIYKTEPSFIKKLQNVVRMQRRFQASTLRQIIPPRRIYRKERYNVRSLAFARRHGRPVVELFTLNKRAKTIVDARFWKLTSLICPEPNIYATSPSAPVLIDDGRSVKMVIMPISP